MIKFSLTYAPKSVSSCVSIGFFSAFLMHVMVISTAVAQDLSTLLANVKQDNPEIRLEMERALAEQSNVAVAKARLYPTLILDASLMRKRMSDDSSNSNTENVYDYTLSLEQNLFDGFDTRSRIDESEYVLGSAQARLNNRTNLTLTAAAEAYLNTLKYYTLLQSAEGAIEIAAEQLDIERQKMESGGSSNRDLLAAQKNLTDYKARKASTQRRLARYVGLYQRYFGAAPDLASMSMPTVNTDVLPQSTDELMTMVGQSAAIQAQMLTAQAAQQRVRRAESAYYPTVDLSLNYGKENDNFSATDATRRKTAEAALQLDLRWELSSYLTNEDAVEAARNNALAAASRASVALRRQQGDAMDAWSVREAAMMEQKALLDVVNFEGDSLALQRQEAEQGGGDLASLLRSELLAIRNVDRLITVQHDVVIAEIELLAQTGHGSTLLNP